MTKGTGAIERTPCIEEPKMEIIQRLMDALGVKEDQAKGGVGMLLKLAREKLREEDFSKIAEAIPEADKLADDAPEEGAVGGALKGLGSLFGKKGESAGDMAGLVSGFSKLGLEGGMIGKFVSAIVSFVQEKGGDELKGILEKVLAPKP
jgi:hypothetical protein